MRNPFIKFRQRSMDEEIMDDIQTKGEVVERTLKELDFINTYLGGNAIVMSAIAKIFEEHKGDLLTIADLGCGSGTLLMLIADLAESYGVKVKLLGVDANDFIIQYAKNNTKDYSEIEFINVDVLSEQFLSQSFDIVICSLFCHHIEDGELIKLMNKLYLQTRRAIIISDLHRHWFAYYSISILTSLFSSSSMVKYDSKLSVLRAFKKSELKQLFLKSEVAQFTLKWKWAFRYEMVVDCRKIE